MLRDLGAVDFVRLSRRESEQRRGHRRVALIAVIQIERRDAVIAQSLGSIHANDEL